MATVVVVVVVVDTSVAVGVSANKESVAGSARQMSR